MAAEELNGWQRALVAETKLAVEQAVGPLHTALGEHGVRVEALKEDVGEVKEACTDLGEAVAALATETAVIKAVAKNQARRTAIPITVGGTISIGLIWQLVKNALGLGSNP